MSRDWSTGRKIPHIPILGKQSSWLRFKGWGDILVVVLGLVDKARGALMLYGVQGCQQWKSLAWREK